MAVNIFRMLRLPRLGCSQNLIAIFSFIVVFLYATQRNLVEEIRSSDIEQHAIGEGDDQINEHLDPGDEAEPSDETAWMLLQETRKKAVEEACRDIPKDVLLPTILTTKDSRNQLLVDDQHKAIYCYIPKVASLNWRKAWMVLNGMMKNGSNVTLERVRTAFDMKTLKYVEDVDVLKKQLETYKKVIVVRHPLERLLSVYFDEVRIPNLAKRVLPTVRKTRPLAKLTDIEWPEFVEYIIKEGVIDSKYWITYEDLCHPCAIDYDVIVKFETFKEDSTNYLKQINVSGLVQIQDPALDHSSVGSDILQKYLDVLTERQLEALRRKYDRDFKLFEYH